MATLRSIIEATAGMRKIASMDLKVKDALSVARLIKKLDEECRLYNELRDKICRKYGELNEDKTAYVFKDDVKEKALSEFQELDSSEIELGEKIKIVLPKDVKIDAISLLTTEELVEIIFEEEKRDG